MECIRVGFMRHPDNGAWMSYPCGQCLPCRVKRQSAWELRNLLEYQTSDTSSFVTLTINDTQMQNWASLPPSKQLRRFFDALRAVERRAQVTTQIRFFGCLEYGGAFGRPHYHLLVYGQVATLIPPIPRKNGLPAHQLDIAQWPHGHIDVGTVTRQSIRYVASYLTKDLSQQTTLFRTIRPGIGSTGIQALAESIARKQRTLCTMPAYFQIGGRKYPLDTFTRNSFRKAYTQAGGTIITNEDYVEKALQRLSLHKAKIDTDFFAKNRQKILEKIEELKNAEAKKESREIEITKIYNNLSSRSHPFEGEDN